jgi:HEAT repeat protein
MRHLRELHRVVARRPRAFAALGFFIFLAAVGTANVVQADQLPPDPVEELRYALKADRDAGKTKAGEDYRKATLEKRIAALTSPGDMAQALLLTEWRDASSLDRAVAIVDQQAREKLANKFKAAVQAILTKDDTSPRAAVARAAVAGLVGDTAGIARDRGVQPIMLQTVLADLALDLVKATNDPDQRVRVQAIRSLGKIHADPTKVVPTLDNLLTKQPDEIRRAVAEALASLVRILPQIEKKPRTTDLGGAIIPVEAIIQLTQSVVHAVGKGLNDADPEVRRLAADTLWQAALVLSDKIPDPRDRDYPPPGRPLSEEEKKDIDFDRETVVRTRKQLMPLMTALAEQTPALSAATTDKDTNVRVLALHTLEEMGNARARLLRQAASVPETQPLNGGDKKEAEKKKEGASATPQSDTPIRFAALGGFTTQPPFRLAAEEDPLLGALRGSIRALARALEDPKTEVRLAAVDALEMLGDEAAPASARLGWALTDPDRFVRWAAARTLGRMTPSKTDTAQVVKFLSAMLSDPDLDLRLMAAQSLERYGPAAKAAVPALARAAVTGDAEIRRAAIRALVGIGTDAEPAIPNIGAALENPDVRVRRAAADALSRFGPLAKPAEKPLREALNDPDPEVRRLAEDALLKIK